MTRVNPLVNHEEQDQQGIVSQLEKICPPTPVVEASDQESECPHPASSIIYDHVQDNDMREVCDTVPDKRLSTDEDSIGSRLCLLEASLRVLLGLFVMIEDTE